MPVHQVVLLFLSCFIMVSQGQCAGRLRGLVPVVSSPRYFTSTYTTSDELTPIVFQAAGPDKCKEECECNQKKCSCESRLNSDELIMKLINALVLTSVNNSESRYLQRQDDIRHQLNLLEKRTSGGVEDLTLRAAGKDVLSVVSGASADNASSSVTSISELVKI